MTEFQPKRHRWFGSSVPSEFADPAVNRHLSFNGQVHFRCTACLAVTWADIAFAAVLIKGGSDFPCPNCKKKELNVLQFIARESRLCKQCGTESLGNAEDSFRCNRCSHDQFVIEQTVIQPTYPEHLYALYGRKQPFGVSVAEDEQFLLEHVRGLQMSPEFHKNCVHLIPFIDSIFAHIYGSSEKASGLLNLASGLMREVYRATGDLDAGYLSIAIMMEGRDRTLEPLQHAVYGFNTNQNLYSVLARNDDRVVHLRFGFDLKQYAVWLSGQTLAEFNAINSPTIAELRARQKWLLGDILKAGDPTEEQIDEALQWFDAARKDSALPTNVRDYVDESALSARMKRKKATPAQRIELQQSRNAIAAKTLAATQGLQRIGSLTELLRSEFQRGSGSELQDLALRCLGEALIYVGGGDPENMLRYSGSVLSRLAAGFAASRFRVGAFLEGMAGVEAFRSLAIGPAIDKVSGRQVSKLELSVGIQRLLGAEGPEPVKLAREMVREFGERIKEELLGLIGQGEQIRSVFWCEMWDGTMLRAVVNRKGSDLAITADSLDIPVDDATNSFRLPMADEPPGLLRARRLENSLISGWKFFESALQSEPVSRPLIFVGPSFIGSWPVDASEALQRTPENGLRPVSFTPSIAIAHRMRTYPRASAERRVLVLSYGGKDLPAISQEIEDIKLAYGSGVTILNGATVTKAEVLGQLAGPFAVLHFCGHADFNYLEPMKSALWFQDGGGAEGRIMASEILSCGTVGNNPVVVLSACTSALVFPNGSNNFLGLAGALIRTGAAAVVGARWPVSDAGAATFSSYLHRQLSNGKSVGLAVAAAKERMRSAALDDWSAFMSIGG